MWFTPETRSRTSWRTPAKVSRRTCHKETMVADKGNQTGSLLDRGGPRSHVVSCEVNHAGSLLHSCPDCFLCPDVGVYQGVRTPLIRRGANGIRNCRSYCDLSFHLSDVRVASSGTFLGPTLMLFSVGEPSGSKKAAKRCTEATRTVGPTLIEVVL